MFAREEQYYSERLNSLIGIAFQGQWSPQEKIDWDKEIVIPENIDNKTYIDMVSQLYYAEEATIQIIASLLKLVPDTQAKQYLCTQAVDEARHQQVYGNYLKKLGDIAPINESLKIVLENGLSGTFGYQGSIIALNVVMEGEALNQQKKRITTLPCPLFKEINSTIVNDEARHAAFGRVYMREKLVTMPKDKKYEIYKWIRDLWQLWSNANSGRYLLDGADVLRTDNSELDIRWMEQRKLLKSIGLIEDSMN